MSDTKRAADSKSQRRGLESDGANPSELSGPPGRRPVLLRALRQQRYERPYRSYRVLAVLPGGQGSRWRRIRRHVTEEANQ